MMYEISEDVNIYFSYDRVILHFLQYDVIIQVKKRGKNFSDKQEIEEILGFSYWIL